MQKTSIDVKSIYEKAVDAFICGALDLYLKDLSFNEVKELKYYVLSNNLKHSVGIMYWLNEHEIKSNTKKDFTRVYKGI